MVMGCVSITVFLRSISFFFPNHNGNQLIRVNSFFLVLHMVVFLYSAH